MLSGALSKDGEIWDNNDTEDSNNFADQLKKWKATLVDFGFARALLSNQAENDTRDMKRESRRASYHDIMQITNSASSMDGSSEASSRISSRLGIRSSKRSSVSHLLLRKMSGEYHVHDRV